MMAALADRCLRMLVLASLLSLGALSLCALAAGVPWAPSAADRVRLVSGLG